MTMDEYFLLCVLKVLDINARNLFGKMGDVIRFSRLSFKGGCDIYVRKQFRIHDVTLKHQDKDIDGSVEDKTSYLKI